MAITRWLTTSPSTPPRSSRNRCLSVDIATSGANVASPSTPPRMKSSSIATSRRVLIHCRATELAPAVVPMVLLPSQEQSRALLAFESASAPATSAPSSTLCIISSLINNYVTDSHFLLVLQVRLRCCCCNSLVPASLLSELEGRRIDGAADIKLLMGAFVGFSR